VFAPQLGALQSRSGKRPRPIVIAPIENRIVQRAILDVLKGLDEIRRILATPSSFGGIENRDRRDALMLAHNTIQLGARFYVRSDIRDFFSAIPRDYVHEFIATFVKDVAFLDLLRRATETELTNMALLRGDVDRFPIHEIGVAQGCALSPLLGNILLRDFDSALNERGIVCVRYIDDLLLLGKEKRSVLKAFDNARDLLLGKFGLKLYDPRDGGDKAAIGDVVHGFDFLGCHVLPGMIQPSAKSRSRLRVRIQEIVDDCRRSMQIIASGRAVAAHAVSHGDARTAVSRHRRKIGIGLVPSLSEIDNVVRGWGHSYSFCNSAGVMAGLDHMIDAAKDALLATYDGYRSTGSPTIDRRLLGVQLLQDIPTVQIVN